VARYLGLSYPIQERELGGAGTCSGEAPGCRRQKVRARSKPTVDLRTCTEPYVTVSELARYWRVSVDTIYRDIKKGALTTYRVGSSRAIRISTAEARRYGRPAPTDRAADSKD
jgi:excisionase family DNA binding protein